MGYYSISRLCTRTVKYVYTYSVYTGDTAPTDSHLFICEHHTLTDLLEGMKTPLLARCGSHEPFRKKESPGVEQ